MDQSSLLPSANKTLRQRSSNDNATWNSNIEPPAVGSNHASQHWRRKPILYLHAGPYKTATSFLQCVLSQNAHDVLKTDGIAYLGTCAFECRRPRYDYCEPHSQFSFFSSSGELKPDFVSKVNALYQDGQSDALIVWEYLSDLKPVKLQALISAFQGWEIRVIFNYRRLFEWLPSL
jgi:hypothetical protein